MSLSSKSDLKDLFQKLRKVRVQLKGKACAQHIAHTGLYPCPQAAAAAATTGNQMVCVCTCFHMHISMRSNYILIVSSKTILPHAHHLNINHNGEEKQINNIFISACCMTRGLLGAWKKGNMILKTENPYKLDCFSTLRF